MARIAASSAALIRESIEAFNGITNEPCLRLCYVGSDSYAEGQTVGNIIGHSLGGKGQAAVIAADLQSVNHILRRKGALSVLAEEYPGVEAVETVETFESGEKTYAASIGLMKRHPDLRAIYVTEGGTPSFCGQGGGGFRQDRQDRGHSPRLDQRDHGVRRSGNHRGHRVPGPLCPRARFRHSPLQSPDDGLGAIDAPLPHDPAGGAQGQLLALLVQRRRFDGWRSRALGQAGGRNRAAN